MTAEERKNCLDAIYSLRFDNLPDAAVRFILDYLMSSESTWKVKHLLDEASRLNAYSGGEEPYHECVTYPP